MKCHLYVVESHHLHLTDLIRMSSPYMTQRAQQRSASAKQAYRWLAVTLRMMLLVTVPKKAIIEKTSCDIAVNGSRSSIDSQ